jgi:hypothetical protein
LVIGDQLAELGSAQPLNALLDTLAVEINAFIRNGDVK